MWWKDWITWPTSPPAPTTGKPTSTPSARPLSKVMVAVKLDEYSSCGLRGDRRQRLQEREVLERRQLAQLVRARSPSRSAAARSWPMVRCSCSFSRLQRPVVERAGEEVPDRG